jgi:hypothetical protein
MAVAGKALGRLYSTLAVTALDTASALVKDSGHGTALSTDSRSLSQCVC